MSADPNEDAVHDKLVAAIKNAEWLFNAWYCDERTHRYLELPENAEKIRLLARGYRGLDASVNKVSTTPRVRCAPRLRVVNGGLSAWAGEGEI